MLLFESLVKYQLHSDLLTTIDKTQDMVHRLNIKNIVRRYHYKTALRVGRFTQGVKPFEGEVFEGFDILDYLHLYSLGHARLLELGFQDLGTSLIQEQILPDVGVAGGC